MAEGVLVIKRSLFILLIGFHTLVSAREAGVVDVLVNIGKEFYGIADGLHEYAMKDHLEYMLDKSDSIFHSIYRDIRKEFNLEILEELIQNTNLTEKIELDLEEMLDAENPPLALIFKSAFASDVNLYDNQRPNIRIVNPFALIILACPGSRFESLRPDIQLTVAGVLGKNNFGIVYSSSFHPAINLSNENILIETRTTLSKYKCERTVRNMIYKEPNFYIGVKAAVPDASYIIHMGSITFDKKTDSPISATHLVSPRSVGIQGYVRNVTLPRSKPYNIVGGPLKEVYNTYNTITNNLALRNRACSFGDSLSTFSPHLLIPNEDLDNIGLSDMAVDYANSFPQYSVMQNGNLKKVENAIRERARRLSRALLEETYLIELIMRNGQALYLHNPNGKKKIPVPKFIKKVIYDNEENMSVEIMISNDPYNRNAFKNLQETYASCVRIDMFANIGLVQDPREGLISCAEGPGKEFSDKPWSIQI